MTKDEPMSLNKAIAGLTPLMSQENSTLWEQGDFLVKTHLSTEEIVKLADYFQRKPSTLIERERVAREFPFEIRDTSIAFGIYRILLRIPTRVERQALLDSRPHQEWAHSSMTRAVREYMGRNTRTTEQVRVGENISYHHGARVGNIKVDLTLSENGMLEIKLHSAAGKDITSHFDERATLLILHILDQ